MRHYKLINNTPVLELDLLSWAQWMESVDRQIAFMKIDGIEISTDFMGLDPNPSHENKPLLFETVVYLSRKKYGQMACYFSYSEAIKGHDAIVQIITKQQACMQELTLKSIGATVNLLSELHSEI